MKATIHMDAYGDIELPGTLTGIGAMAKMSTFRARYVGEIPIRIKLEKMDSRVIPDLTGSAEIVLSERPHRCQVNLRGKAADPAFVARVASAIGLALPEVPNTTTSDGGITALWLGPDEWLITARPGREAEIAGKLQDALAGLFASATDVTEARTVIAVAGPRARALMAKATSLDILRKAVHGWYCGVGGEPDNRIALREEQDVAMHEHCILLLSLELAEGRLQVFWLPGVRRGQEDETQLGRSVLEFASVGWIGQRARVLEHANAFGGGQRLREQLHALLIEARNASRQARDIAAGPGERICHTSTHRVGAEDHDDRD